MERPRASDPLAERVRVSPEHAALVRASDGESWTFAAFDDAVEATAGRLAALGVDAGDHVGLLAETRPAAVRVVFAALRLGAVAVPLNARLTPAELGPQVDHADLVALVCEAATEADALAAVDETDPDGSVPIASVDAPTSDVVSTLAEYDSRPIDPATPDIDDTRLLLFTSGTMGDPKAVELTAGNLRSSATASALRLGVEPDDRWFDPLSIYHMGGFAPIYRSICYGTTAIVQRDFDEARTLEAIDAHDATCLSVVPAMVRRLLDSSDAAPRTLGSLRFVLSGGAATPHELVERCADHDVPLCPTYGITETTSQVATALPAEAREHEGTVGRPLLPTEVTILDEEGDPLPAGEPGEVVVDGPTVSPGYHADPEATAATRSERGYHTGDLGYRDAAGRLWVLGRVDDRVVTGGEVVDPTEVVDVLRSHDAVRDAAVVGLDDDEWGERVGALLATDGVESASERLTPAAVRDHCDGDLAGYKHPRTVALVDDLPRTPSGTVDREAVRRRLREHGSEC